MKNRNFTVLIACTGFFAFGIFIGIDNKTEMTKEFNRKFKEYKFLDSLANKAKIALLADSLVRKYNKILEKSTKIHEKTLSKKVQEATDIANQKWSDSWTRKEKKMNLKHREEKQILIFNNDSLSSMILDLLRKNKQLEKESKNMEQIISEGSLLGKFKYFFQKGQVESDNNAIVILCFAFFLLFFIGVFVKSRNWKFKFGRRRWRLT
jgi:hypothetical protein